MCVCVRVCVIEREREMEERERDGREREGDGRYVERVDINKEIDG